MFPLTLEGLSYELIAAKLSVYLLCQLADKNFVENILKEMQAIGHQLSNMLVILLSLRFNCPFLIITKLIIVGWNFVPFLTVSGVRKVAIDDYSDQIFLM